MAIVDDDRMDDLLRHAAPAVRFDEDDVPAEVLRVLASEVINTSPAGSPRRRRSFLNRRWRRVWAVPLAAGVVALSAAAGLEIWHNTASPDFVRVLDDYSAHLPLPPGTDRAAYVAQVRDQGKQLNAAVSDLGVQSMVSHYGVCAWLTAWDVRHSAGDPVAEAQAVEALRRAVAAPALREADGGGVVAGLERVVAAAARGDRAPVVAELGYNCADAPLDGIR
jgi:hypothetical protein